MDAWIDALLMACVGVALAMSVLSVQAFVEDRQVLSLPVGHARVMRSYVTDTRDRLSMVTVRFPEGTGTDVVCDVDVRVGSGGQRIRVGSDVRIARSAPGCGAPLLVDHLGTIVPPFVAASGASTLGILLYLLRRHRRRKAA